MKNNEPLAYYLRPTTLDEVVWQEQTKASIQKFLENWQVPSMIFWWTPWCGKTTVANVLSHQLQADFFELSWVKSKKEDLNLILEHAEKNKAYWKKTLLFLDEIHRRNKAQQDSLLPFVESGLITLIGMTTSNPYHSINPAIRSRCQLFELEELKTENIIEGLNRAIKHEDLKGIKIDEESINLIAHLSENDLRYAYNLLEVAFYATDNKIITAEKIKMINNKPVFFSDKDGDGHYDILSGLQKSIRGSDVDASLHYAARLVLEGDLDSLFRRLSVIAYEDIGLANPSIGPKLEAAINAALRIGLPEARIPIGTIIIEMALSPKSNTAHIALDKALEDIENGNVGNLPKHLRTGSKDYLYPHDFPNAYVKQQYLPDKIKNKKYYYPKTIGYEKTISEIYKKIEQLKKEG